MTRQEPVRLKNTFKIYFTVIFELHNPDNVPLLKNKCLKKLIDSIKYSFILFSYQRGEVARAEKYKFGGFLFARCYWLSKSPECL